MKIFLFIVCFIFLLTGSGEADHTEKKFGRVMKSFITITSIVDSSDSEEGEEFMSFAISPPIRDTRLSFAFGGEPMTDEDKKFFQEVLGFRFFKSKDPICPDCHIRLKRNQGE